MYKQVSIFLLGILFVIIATQGARLPYNHKDELSLKYQQQPKIRGSIHDDHFINELIKSVHRRNVLNIDQSLKRNKRAFTNEQSQFQQEMLQAHNEYRSHHCVSPLQLDDGLSSSAQQYAEYLVAIDTLQHSGTPDVGENLYMMGSSDQIANINGNQPTDSWYNEVQQYNYDQPGFSTETGHFTQLVWKNTERIGAGIAFNNDRTKVYVVAQYSPPGNYEGQYEENVLPANC